MSTCTYQELAEKRPISGIRRALRALFLKADLSAIQLLETSLRQAGYEPVMIPVDTAADLRQQLGHGRWEVVFCDSRAPGFDCASAIAVLQEGGQDLPFMVITDSLGEDRAAQIMKAGAHDVLRDDQLSRLPGAVARELAAARMRRLHRKVGAELVETTARLSALVDSAPLAIIECDPTGRVRLWNASAKRIFGWDNKEVLGENLLVVPMDQRSEFQAMCGEAQRGKSFTGVEVHWGCKDGAMVELTLSLAPLPNGLLLMASEHGDMTRLQRRLDRAQHHEAIGQLTSGLAQDISSPLTIINHELEFLSQAGEELALALTVHHDLAIAGNSDLSVQAAAKRMVAICQRIDLDYLLLEIPRSLIKAQDNAARIGQIVHAMGEAGPPPADNKGLLDLNRALECACTIARSEFRHVADLVLDLQPDMPAIECDPEGINCILLNLLVNAAHAVAESAGTKGRGVIIASTRDVDGILEVQIHDTGTGIPTAVRSRIFEPFFTTKPLGRSTGQGLAIALKIAQRHHGTLTFESQEGSSTTFVLSLPKKRRPSVS